MQLTKREFLKMSAIGGAGLLLAPQTVLGSNSDIHVGVIGVRSKGAHHLDLFRKISGVRIAAICDADKDILNREVAKSKEMGERAKAYTDVRKLLDNKHIDVVVIATPNHWHALMAVWACQAGKDVYVEKPVSHNVWEGRKIVDTARKYNRIVQAGTQNRSDTALQEVFQYIQQGNLGKINAVHGLCYKRRKSIGKVTGPQPVPESVDYNLWLGPAPMAPVMREQFHYDWHWQWPAGNGDIGNQGVHEMDMCRWVLGENKLPNHVFSIGGRFGYDDDGDTPNTQIAVLEYDSAPIIFEVRGLPSKKNFESMDNYKGIRIGLVVKCEDGYFAGGAGGGWIYDNKGNKIKQFNSDGGWRHQQNFIDAVRSRKRRDLTADIEEGHVSSALCHLGNISHRIGHLTPPDTIKETVQNIYVKDAFRRFQDHLFMNWVDVNKMHPVLGPKLLLHPQKEMFISNDDYDYEFWANTMIKRSYRAPFVVPDKI